MTSWTTGVSVQPSARPQTSTDRSLGETIGDILKSPGHGSAEALGHPRGGQQEDLERSVTTTSQ
jgi:hypothetical protein